MHIHYPTVFDCSIERFQGESIFFLLSGNDLIYKKISSQDFFSEAVEQVISFPDWNLFFSKIQPLAIWSLQKEYGATLIAKTWWHINIAYCDNQVVSCGINIFPDNKTESTSSFFKYFYSALYHLITPVN